MEGLENADLCISGRSTHPGAAAYVNFLRSPSAKLASEKQGFIVLQ
jgi:hypothetical protein